MTHGRLQPLMILPRAQPELGLSDSRTLGVSRQDVRHSDCSEDVPSREVPRARSPSPLITVFTTIWPQPASLSLLSHPFLPFSLSLCLSFSSLKRSSFVLSLRKRSSQSASFLSFHCMMYRKERTAADNIELLDMASVDMQGLPVWSHHS